MQKPACYREGTLPAEPSLRGGPAWVLHAGHLRSDNPLRWSWLVGGQQPDAQRGLLPGAAQEGRVQPGGQRAAAQLPQGPVPGTHLPRKKLSPRISLPASARVGACCMPSSLRLPADMRSVPPRAGAHVRGQARQDGSCGGGIGAVTAGEAVWQHGRASS